MNQDHDHKDILIYQNHIAIDFNKHKFNFFGNIFKFLVNLSTKIMYIFSNRLKASAT